MFDNATISVPCPGCGHKSEKSLGWLNANDHFLCQGCGRNIQLNTEELRAALKSADKSLADFTRSLIKLGK